MPSIGPVYRQMVKTITTTYIAAAAAAAATRRRQDRTCSVQLQLITVEARSTVN